MYGIFMKKIKTDNFIKMSQFLPGDPGLPPGTSERDIARRFGVEDNEYKGEDTVDIERDWADFSEWYGEEINIRSEGTSSLYIRARYSIVYNRLTSSFEFPLFDIISIHDVMGDDYTEYGLMDDELERAQKEMVEMLNSAGLLDDIVD